MAKALPRPVYVVAARRTPFGAFGGSLSTIGATELGVVATTAALASAGVDPARVDTVVFGNVLQTSADAIYLARHIGLRAGIPIAAPALTVNRLCGSGFQAVISAAQEILLGTAELAVAGGTESMSQAPFAVRGTRFGVRLGVSPVLEDVLWSALTDSYCDTAMAITAENLAGEYDISREDADGAALASQQRWAAAQETGRFAAELAPVSVTARGKTKLVEHDEHPRADASPAALAKLPPAFRSDGIVTAGNASGICDGAGALVLAGDEAVKALQLRPLARLVQWHVAGVEPTRMGIGPVPAIRGALNLAGLALGDMELVEINEAFAPQFLACAKELGLDRERTNVDGGAIALGHPLAASGARILTHLVHELARRRARYGIGSACIGGGQGVAVVVENLA